MDNFKYWEDCTDQTDIDALWADPQVGTEWLDAGEERGQKVHMSRDPDGQAYLTQTEMRAVANIIVCRHFRGQIDPAMICAIADLESDRQPLATGYVKKTKETTYGIMQITQGTAEWLFRELGYQHYQIEGDQFYLFRPFLNVYLGAAYLKWLANFEQKPRSEEFMVRSFKGGTKKATHKSTLPFWTRYVSVKEGLPSSMSSAAGGPSLEGHEYYNTPVSPRRGPEGDSDCIYWDARTSPEDMEDMWKNRDVHKEWMKSREKRGQVRFSRDERKRLYVSKVELKAVAEIILSKHFSSKRVQPTVLCAIAEITSMRYVDGNGSRTGLMGIEFKTAYWLYELGYNGYIVQSPEDVKKPFVSMYFAAAYMAWLSEYEGRERPPKFIVQAYLSGPENVNPEEAGPGWHRFKEALSHYEDLRAHQGSCSIL